MKTKITFSLFKKISFGLKTDGKVNQESVTRVLNKETGECRWAGAAADKRLANFQTVQAKI